MKAMSRIITAILLATLSSSLLGVTGTPLVEFKLPSNEIPINPQDPLNSVHIWWDDLPNNQVPTVHRGDSRWEFSSHKLFIHGERKLIQPSPLDPNPFPEYEADIYELYLPNFIDPLPVKNIYLELHYIMPQTFPPVGDLPGSRVLVEGYDGGFPQERDEHGFY